MNPDEQQLLNSLIQVPDSRNEAYEGVRRINSNEISHAEAFPTIQTPLNFVPLYLPVYPTYPCNFLSLPFIHIPFTNVPFGTADIEENNKSDEEENEEIMEEDETGTMISEEVTRLALQHVQHEFCIAVLERFHDRPHETCQFLYILEEHCSGQFSVQEVYKNMAELFSQDQDLFEEFLYLFRKS